MAHDFNNLLTVIGGHVFMLEQASADHSANQGEPDPRSANTSRASRARPIAPPRSRGSSSRSVTKQLLSPTLLDVNAVEETLT